MITEITDNIVFNLTKFFNRNNSHFDQTEDIKEIREIIATELSKYKIEKRVTALVVHDKSDFEIIGKFFIAKTTAGLSKETLYYYKKTLEKTLPRLGKRLNDVRADDIRAYLTMRRVEGVTNLTLDNERRILSTFFGFIHEEGLIDINPTKRIEKIKIQKIQKKPLSEDEMERLRVAAKTDRNKAIIEFLYSTCCRVSEVVRINRDQIDFEQREVIVLGKGNKERKVFLSYRCVSALKTYLATRKDNNPALFVNDYGKKGSFGRIGTTRLKKSGIETMISVVGKRAGIINAHPHRIRRTAATIALRRGMPIEQVSKMLGHEDLKTTTIYASSTLDEVKQSHDKYLI